MSAPRKILVIRFSSIGDIVLTTPLLRTLKEFLPESEIHFLTKSVFSEIVANNPNLSKFHLFGDDLSSTIKKLQAENFDFVIDLHNSIRSRIVRKALKKPGSVYNKFRLRTGLFTKFRIGSLPHMHIVERYMAAIRTLGCSTPPGPLEIFIPLEIISEAEKKIKTFSPDPPVAVVLGGKWFTKKWPVEYFVELLNRSGKPVVLLGGTTERKDADLLIESLKVPVFDSVAKDSIMQSAALMKQCRYVITHDTGFMHIAAALRMKIFSIWGNTVPEFGFSPWKAESVIIENTNLKCRPCNKIGYDKCPKGHFKCMREIKPMEVLTIIENS